METTMKPSSSSPSSCLKRRSSSILHTRWHSYLNMCNANEVIETIETSPSSCLKRRSSSILHTRWHSYLNMCNANEVIETIETAIILAAQVNPDQFKSMRNHIAELLFSSHHPSITNHPCCVQEPIKPLGPSSGDAHETKEVLVVDEKVVMKKNDKEEKTNNPTTTTTTTTTIARSVLVHPIPCSILQEVFKIKQLLSNNINKSEEVLIQSLKSLQKLPISFEILDDTKIAVEVSCCKKHTSERIRDLSRTLIRNWRIVAHEWIKANEERTSEAIEDQDDLMLKKLESTKRKLHQGYQHAQNVKKQRTIKLIDFRELPKQKAGQRSHLVKAVRYNH